MLTTMFVPIRRVEKYWYDVVKPLVTSEDLQQLIDYMERIWIGESISGRSTTPALAKLRSSFQASRQLSTGEE
jgi:hypothetical protein